MADSSSFFALLSDFSFFFLSTGVVLFCYLLEVFVHPVYAFFATKWYTISCCPSASTDNLITNDRKLSFRTLSLFNKLSLSYLVPDVLTWPVFYCVTFFVFPLLLGFMILSFVRAENESRVQSLFIQNPENRKLTIAANITLWLSVYFFSIMPLSSLMLCLDDVIHRYECYFLYDLFPISFSRRLHLQFGGIAGFFLVLGTLFTAISANSASPEDEPATDTSTSVINGDEIVDHLILAIIVLPWSVLMKFGRNGFRLILDLLFLDRTPGSSFLWWASHLAFGVVIFVCLFRANPIAGQIILWSWCSLWLIPNLMWISGLRRGYIQSEERTSLSNRVEWNMGYVALSTKLHIDSCFLQLTKPEYVEVGQRVWLFLNENYVIPVPFCQVFTLSKATEAVRSIRLLEFKSFVNPNPVSFAIEVQEAPVSLTVFLLFTGFFLFFDLLVHSIRRLLIGSLQLRNDMEPGSRLKVWAAPPVGRRLMLLEQPKLPESIVFCIDSPGIPSALCHLMALVRQRESMNSKANLCFIWFCDDSIDVAKVYHCIYSLLSGTDSKVGKSLHKLPKTFSWLEISILCRHSSKSAVRDLMDQINIEGPSRVGLIRLKNHVHSCPRNQGFEHFEFASIWESYAFGNKSCTVVTIGSAALAYTVRREYWRSSSKRLTLFEIIIEKSIWDLPGQSSETPEVDCESCSDYFKDLCIQS